MDAATLWDKLAVTEALERTDGANARQISAVPSCEFVRLTKTHVALAPVTPVTVTPADVESVAMNASSSSLPEWVVKAGEDILLDVASVAMAARDSLLREAAVKGGDEMLLDVASVVMTARNSSLREAVVKAGDEMLCAGLDRSVDVTTSRARSPQTGVAVRRTRTRCRAGRLALTIKLFNLILDSINIIFLSISQGCFSTSDRRCKTLTGYGTPGLYRRTLTRLLSLSTGVSLDTPTLMRQ
jgi:hypothetical protein